METVTYIAHYGIKDMHWGERRFQNEDGSLTAAGKERYARQASRDLNRMDRDLSNHRFRAQEAKSRLDSASKRRQKLVDKGVSEESKRVQKLDARIKKADSEYTQKHEQYSQTHNAMDSKVLDLQVQGYHTMTKPTIRNVKLTGAEAALNVGAVVAGAAVMVAAKLPMVVVPQYSPTIEGTKFKVRTDSKVPRGYTSGDFIKPNEYATVIKFT